MAPVLTDVNLTSSGGYGFNLTPAGVQVVANPPDIPNAWAYSSNIVNSAGQQPSAEFLKAACPNLRKSICSSSAS